jgi:hypothetical protein
MKAFKDITLGTLLFFVDVNFGFIENETIIIAEAKKHKQGKNEYWKFITIVSGTDEITGITLHEKDWKRYSIKLKFKILNPKDLILYSYLSYKTKRYYKLLGIL